MKKYNKGFIELNRPCPLCGSMMIKNRKYIECSARDCEHIEFVIEERVTKEMSCGHVINYNFFIYEDFIK